MEKPDLHYTPDLHHTPYLLHTLGAASHPNPCEVVRRHAA